MDKGSTERHNFGDMLEGIVVSVVIAYVGGWIFLKCFHAWDERQARKITERTQRKHPDKTPEQIIAKAKADALHGWD